jgi:hypothetical protein
MNIRSALIAHTEGDKDIKTSHRMISHQFSFKCCIKNLNYFLLSLGKKCGHSDSYGSIL